MASNCLLSFLCLLYSLKEHFGIASLSDLIALLISTSQESSGGREDLLLPEPSSSDLQLLADLRLQLPIAELSSSGPSALEQLAQRLGVGQWTACLKDDQGHFWTLGNYCFPLLPFTFLTALSVTVPLQSFICLPDSV